MLLVMDTAGIFQTGDGTNSQLWRLTWDRIGTFLPHLKEELFKTPEPGMFSFAEFSHNLNSDYFNLKCLKVISSLK